MISPSHETLHGFSPETSMRSQITQRKLMELNGLKILSVTFVPSSQLATCLTLNTRATSSHGEDNAIPIWCSVTWTGQWLIVRGQICFQMVELIISNLKHLTIDLSSQLLIQKRSALLEYSGKTDACVTMKRSVSL